MASLQLLALFFLYRIVLSVGTTVSVANYLPYGEQHGCVQHCIEGQEVFRDVGQALQCDQPYHNQCYCAINEAAAASSFITFCVSSSCAAGDLPADVTSAISVYDSYCLTAGYTLPGVVLVSPSPSATPAPSTGVATVTLTVTTPGSGYVTVTAHSSWGEPSIARSMMSSHLTGFYLTIGALMIIPTILIAGLRFRF